MKTKEKSCNNAQESADAFAAFLVLPSFFTDVSLGFFLWRGQILNYYDGAHVTSRIGSTSLKNAASLEARMEQIRVRG